MEQHQPMRTCRRTGGGEYATNETLAEQATKADSASVCADADPAHFGRAIDPADDGRRNSTSSATVLRATYLGRRDGRPAPPESGTETRATGSGMPGMADAAIGRVVALPGPTFRAWSKVRLQNIGPNPDALLLMLQYGAGSVGCSDAGQASPIALKIWRRSD